MRTIIYGVHDAEQKKIIFTHWDKRKVQTEIEKLGNTERYSIRHTWKSF